jgi:hypothetical protein
MKFKAWRYTAAMSGATCQKRFRLKMYANLASKKKLPKILNRHRFFYGV